MIAMSRRDQIHLSDAELAKYLEASHTMILVSNGPHGFPHPMPMWFCVREDGTVRMTTYRAAQKALNLKRDPNVALLIESGTEYAELKGVVIYGRAELIDDFDEVVDTLVRVSGGRGLPEEDAAAQRVRESMRRNAEKRVVVAVKPERVVSWDHAKLAGVY
jgi:PPOX class probable F420-dependent enzyme